MQQEPHSPPRQRPTLKLPQKPADKFGSRKRIASKQTPAGTMRGPKRDLADLDAPRFWPVVSNVSEKRSVSIRPSAVRSLIAGVGKYEGKTWWEPKADGAKLVPLDVHHAIISYWWHSAFPNAPKTPEESAKLEWECYAALTLKYEGRLPEARKEA